jgi:transcriptional regulator
MPPRADLLPGTLDVLVLKAVSLGPLHGYGVLLRIEQMTEGALLVEQGALYPALFRLEQNELLATEWGVSDNNRRAKFYRLTAAGRRRLKEHRALEPPGRRDDRQPLQRRGRVSAMRTRARLWLASVFRQRWFDAASPRNWRSISMRAPNTGRRVACHRPRRAVARGWVRRRRQASADVRDARRGAVSRWCRTSAPACALRRYPAFRRRPCCP